MYAFIMALSTARSFGWGYTVNHCAPMSENGMPCDLQTLTPIQMATAATESYPWWPDILVSCRVGVSLGMDMPICRIESKTGQTAVSAGHWQTL